MTSDCPAANMA